nr:MAG TPA: hypothetical protein [Caudoviricetes sp.]
MEKIYENIINEGKATGKTIEAINTELKEAGANFHLNPDGGVANWTEDEMREGFIPPETEPEALPQTLNTSRREDLAGTVQIQRIVGATYEVTYDENGYFIKASRVRHG